MNEKITISVAEAAKYLGVSKPTVYTLIGRADFPSFKVGSRTLISKTLLEEWTRCQAEAKAAL